MKLIGNGKKDYFDYLIHQYGEDPLTILDRRPIGKFYPEYNNDNVGHYDYVSVNSEFYSFSNRFYTRIDINGYNREEYIDDFLVCNGVAYPLVVTSSYPSVFKIADNTNSSIGKHYRSTATNDPKFVKLSKLIGRHCFILKGTLVSGVVPNLGELGFAKIKSPHEVYLETIDFINQHFAKEAEVSVPQTNKEKIVGHGFDLKTSFRGK